LFHAIRNDEPYNEAEYGALSTMTAIMGRMATYSGKIVKWDEAFKSSISTTTDAEKWDADAPVKANGEGSYAIATPGVTRVV
jgi:myo-inositol 2-dehydrogenase/D-chiro-inositol 1-dehydrogenase